MAEWDIKDGFWQIDCKEGEVLPQNNSKSIT
jgi:hypothetical protein